MLIEDIAPEERRKTMNLEQIEMFILEQYRDEKLSEGGAAMMLGLDRIDLRFLVQTYDFDLVLARRIAPGLRKPVDVVRQMIIDGRQKRAEAARDIQHADDCPITAARKLLEEQ